MILNLFIQLEILFVNLVTTAKISTKKYSLMSTILYLTLFSLLTISIFAIIRTESTPEWIVLLIGLSFIIPLTILNKESLLEMSTIMFFCWTLTMIVSSVSTTLADIINIDMTYLPLIIQTILFTISFAFIQKFAKNTYKVIINGMPKESFSSLLILGSMLLSLSIVVSYFISDNVVKLFMLLLLMVTSYSVYSLLKSFVEKSKKIETLNNIAYIDSLTNLQNRFSLFTATKQLIGDNTSFHCIYMDLDNLKGINDTYGHHEGDQYLIDFANAVNQSISSKSVFYRIAGDEFVCICQDKVIELEKLKKQITTSFNGKHDFNGVSIGYASFPKDGQTIDDLLLLADGKMYSRKNNIKFRINHRSNT